MLTRPTLREQFLREPRRDDLPSRASGDKPGRQGDTTRFAPVEMSDEFGSGLVVTEVERSVTRFWIDHQGVRQQWQQRQRWRRVESSLDLQRNSTPRPDRIRSRTLVGGLLAVVGAGFAAASLLPARGVQPQAGGQEVRIVLPPPAPPTETRSVAPPSPIPSEPARADAPRLVTSPTPLSGPERPAAAAVAPPFVETASSIGAAQRAFLSGSVESWSENGRHGYAAAGPLLLRGGEVCRELTSWVRGGAQGEAKTRVECRPRQADAKPAVDGSEPTQAEQRSQNAR